MWKYSCECPGECVSHMSKQESCPVRLELFQGSFPRRGGGHKHFLPHLHLQLFLRIAGSHQGSIGNNCHYSHPLRWGPTLPSFLPSTCTGCNTQLPQALHREQEERPTAPLPWDQHSMGPQGTTHTTEAGWAQSGQSLQ